MFKSSLLPLVLLALTFAPARAQVSAVTFTPSGNSTALSNTTAGWEFTVSAPIMVTGLSYYDFGGDGLSQNHDVGLWTTVGGVSLGQVTVTNPVRCSTPFVMRIWLRRSF